MAIDAVVVVTVCAVIDVTVASVVTVAVVVVTVCAVIDVTDAVVVTVAAVAAVVDVSSKSCVGREIFSRDNPCPFYSPLKQF